MNANETPELADQIPCFIYPGNVIEILSNVPGDYHGEVHLFYLVDNDFGSFIQGYGLENGGNLMYTALDIEFPNAWIPGSSTENEEIPQMPMTLYNYSNPFNPSTTIFYNIIEACNVSIEVFNIKGQKVKQLISDQFSSGEHSVVWDGRDENNQSVGSGIYFYKLKASDYRKLGK
ncbi:MAG: T9SS type A sorting domain-containing protein [Armatimonadetes bacterium]|nr:T9SS type A sorting domain-containing protein [Armatimonadota bacterium]